MGVKSCARCEGVLSLDQPRVVEPYEEDVTRVGIEMTRPASLLCPACGSAVNVGHKFCHQCGTTMQADALSPPPSRTEPIVRPIPRAGTRPARKTQFFGARQASRAKLVVIRGDGMDGISFTLAGDEHLVGRVGTPIEFEDDPFISPVHANFFYKDGALTVRDEDSTNGVYIRIKGDIPIGFGTRFLVGEQVLELRAPVESLTPKAIDDGTYYFASPPRPAYFHVVQNLLGGHQGLLHAARTPQVRIGREENDINFPDDPFISGQHVHVSRNGDQLTLTDLDSKNGTFVRIDGEHALQHGDYVFMGQQLLRVEIV